MLKLIFPVSTAPPLLVKVLLSLLIPTCLMCAVGAVSTKGLGSLSGGLGGGGMQVTHKGCANYLSRSNMKGSQNQEDEEASLFCNSLGRRRPFSSPSTCSLYKVCAGHEAPSKQVLHKRLSKWCSSLAMLLRLPISSRLAVMAIMPRSQHKFNAAFAAQSQEGIHCKTLK